ncbi:ABC transporter ATP-binding protein [Celerinatantimonas yamalensis]|uniref:ABC transporter ATP-binding protein n=1 Tax=Celerinatantimonas yamalensis TaxID=559956 RepID=A0ABW9G951_9GAMM
MDTILEIKNFSIEFETPEGQVLAVSNMNVALKKGQSLGVVGESGSGKTQTFLALMGLLAKNGRCSGQASFYGHDLLQMSVEQLNQIRGVKMSMIFQDPMTSLNPYLRVSRQMTEVLIEHKNYNKKDALEKAIHMLDLVGIPDPSRRIHMYSHEFSGGMRQRVMIAMALLCEPDLLIADEPTTALDVTIQAQILELLDELKQKLGMSIVIITHDLGVVAGLCDQVMVMYGGRVAEHGDVQQIFYHPQHPYTQGLLQSMPSLVSELDQALYSIPGHPPNLQSLPAGCAFNPRCAKCIDACSQTQPELLAVASGTMVACHHVHTPHVAENLS